MSWIWSSFKLCGNRMYYGMEVSYVPDGVMEVTEDYYDDME